MLKLLPYLISVILFTSVYTQDLHFESILEDKLDAAAAVSSILQDHKGFIWFGTYNGLYCYNGYESKPYMNDYTDSTSISGNNIVTLFEDSNNSIWVGTQLAGLNRFERNTESFISYKHNPRNNRSISSNSISSICEDKQGNLWIGTVEGGLNKLNHDHRQFGFTDSLSFIHFINDTNSQNTVSHNWINALYPDSSGYIWIGTFGNGLDRLDPVNEEFIHFEGISSKYIFTICEDKQENLWIGTASGGVNKFNKNNQKFTPYMHDPADPSSLSLNRVISVLSDHDGTIWIGTYGGGLNIFNPHDESFTSYLKDDENPNSIKNNSVWSIFQDRAGSYWIGTLEGINFIDPSKQVIQEIINLKFSFKDISDIELYSFFEDKDGDFWFGTEENGLLMVERDGPSFTQYVNQKNNPKSLNNNLVFSITEDNLGYIWAGTRQGLSKIDPLTKSFIDFHSHPNTPRALKYSGILSLYEDSNSHLWIGTSYGVYKHDQSDMTFHRYLINPTENLAYKDNAVWSIYEDSSGDIWLAGLNGGGLSRIKRDSTTIKRYLHNHFDPYSLSNNIVYSVFEDSKRNLWIGTDNGLNRFNPSDELFEHIREKDGLAGDIIIKIQEDNQDNLWIATNKGLSRYNHKSKTFKNFDKSDGMPENSCRIYRSTRPDEFLLVSSFGVSAFQPEKLQDNTFIPPVVFTKLKRYNSENIKGTSILEKGISERSSIDFSYKDNIISFEFAALNYINTFKNKYAYKLEGFNDNWIQLNTQRKVTFTNLDPGDYILKIRGSNDDAVWNKAGSSIKISISPPWWRTPIAYAIYVLIILGTGYSIRRYELNRQRLKNNLELEHLEAEKLKEVDTMKSGFFANISHEFRTPLTLIQGPIEKWLPHMKNKEMCDDFQMTQRNCSRLLRLVNQLLDLSKLESGKIKLQVAEEDLVPVLKGLTESFESMAKRKRILLRFQSEKPECPLYFDREKIENIIINLLSNAFKFTPEKGIIEVSLKMSNAKIAMPNQIQNPKSKIQNHDFDYIEIRISNTGHGIPPDHLPHIFNRFYQVDDPYTREQEGSGIGLALTKELVELHHGTIDVKCNREGRSQTVPPTGNLFNTVFTIMLPLGKDHLKDEEIVQDSPDKSVKTGSEKYVSIIEDSISCIPHSVKEKRSSRQVGISATLRPTSCLQSPVILVVEDNADVRHYLRGILVPDQKDPQYNIIDAADGREGLSHALKHHPDLIISDVMMPKMDGIELCKKLKTDRRISHIPFILLTARAAKEDKIEGYEIGADAYLPKPFDKDELRIIIHNLIEQRRKLRNKFIKELAVQPEEITVSSMDKSFLEKAIEIVEKNIEDDQFDTSRLASEIGMSRGHLNVKLKALTGFASREFIRALRLKRAAQLIEQNSGTVSEIAYQVGFNSLSHFSKTFRESFGVLPSEYSSEQYTIPNS